MQSLSIGQLAKLADVSVDTIRFYEKVELLSPQLRRPSGYRKYSQLDVKRLKFIRRGRLLGFSLEEIGELLALEGGQGTAVGVVQQRVRIIDRKIEELLRWRECLLDFIDEPGTTNHGGHSIVDSFSDEAADANMEAQSALQPQEPLKRL